MEKVKEKNLNNEGFTIIELLIATLVFSTVLLVATFGLIRISQIYIKGVIGTQTSNTSRNIMNNLTQSLQLSGGTVYLPQNSNGNIWYFCINGVNYTYHLGTVFTGNSSNPAFLEEPYTGSCSANTGTSGTELLSTNERIVSLGITYLNSKLYQINLKILYGGDNVTVGGNGNTCLSYNGGGEFCSVFQATTTVQQRT